MMHGFKQEVPVDETAALGTDERELYKYRLRVLEQIVASAMLSDIEEVKRLAELL